jgi:hypothetical protein
MEVVAPLSPLSSTLDRAEEAMDTIKTWKSAVAIIKQVMDHVSPIVEVCLASCLSFAKLIPPSPAIPPREVDVETALKYS